MVLAFQDDEELLAKLTPVANDTLGHLVERCHENILEMFNGAVYADSVKAAYRIELEDRDVKTIIGYMVTAKTQDVPNELYSFGINIHYRSRKIVLKWMEETKKLLGDSFWVSLYKQNSRAINFFERNGFTKFVDDTNHFVALCHNYHDSKKGRICQ